MGYITLRLALVFLGMILFNIFLIVVPIMGYAPEGLWISPVELSLVSILFGILWAVVIPRYRT